MDSFTSQDSSYYSTAPFRWITDVQTHESAQANNITPGLFIKNDNPITSSVDKESNLIGLNNIIGKCENIDTDALDKAKALSSGLQTVYTTSLTNNELPSELLQNTRLTQSDKSITETNYNRFNFLPYNPQVMSNIIQDNRGGKWSRNEFKDSYTC